MMNKQYIELLNQLEVEKKKEERLQELKMRKTTTGGGVGACEFWWEASIDDLNVNELEVLKMSMEELKKNVNKRVDELLIKSTSRSSFFVENSSSTGIIDPSSSSFTKPEDHVINQNCLVPRDFNFGFDNGFY
ncbi:hypothetical protein BVC80_1755g32 [Macleaya cordata]|uniref:Uncharacterized protein n=1 Tax=Macleaya cordata TaxID=56857 RepID=A0A200QHT2_MACCD|nr:hypothetical protein BVC80_1755g32 [Macleaya cordata]